MLSRFIKPGSISDQPDNHYSWLRNLEDLFGTSHGGTTARVISATPLPRGAAVRQ